VEVYKNLDINNLENEVWKVITDFPGYQVSNFGRVKSFKRYINGKILKQDKIKDYFYIDLWKNGEYKNKQVHILVYETHNNYKLKPDECVHHINEDKENNIFENLEKMPKSEHLSFHHKGKIISEEIRNKISEKMKGKYIGSNSPNSKLTEEQVIQIKILLKEGKLSQQEIADMFKVSQMTISKIKTGKIWSHVK